MAVLGQHVWNVGQCELLYTQEFLGRDLLSPFSVPEASKFLICLQDLLFISKGAILFDDKESFVNKGVLSPV